MAPPPARSENERMVTLTNKTESPQEEDVRINNNSPKPRKVLLKTPPVEERLSYMPRNGDEREQLTTVQ